MPRLKPRPTHRASKLVPRLTLCEYRVANVLGKMLMRARSWRLPFPVVCASRSSGRRRVESAKTSLFQGPQHTPALISTLVERRQLFGQNVHCHSSHDTTNRAPVYSAISQRLAATAPEQETTPDLSPWMSRDLLMRERATIFEFKVNGVSFHNRQQLLRRLEPSMLHHTDFSSCLNSESIILDPSSVIFATLKKLWPACGVKSQPLALSAEHAIMMVPEPENKHDPFAITVKTTEGQMLGFVPKEINRYPEFKGGVHFGHVASTGTVESEPEMKGFRVCI